MLCHCVYVLNHDHCIGGHVEPDLALKLEDSRAMTDGQQKHWMADCTTMHHSLFQIAIVATLYYLDKLTRRKERSRADIA